MKIAVIQFGAGTDKQGNVEKALSFLEKAAAKHAKFILLPEVFFFRGRLGTKRSLHDIAETTQGPTVSQIRRFAKSKKVYVLAGSIYEKVQGSRKVYNTSLLINPSGNIAAKYRKINLFNAVFGEKSVCESDYFLKGKREATSSIKKFRVGLSVCYDLRFPELYKRYAKRGVDVLTVPSAFTYKTGVAHWEILLRARAIENLSYVVAPNQIGTDSRGIRYYGNSMIVDPWGKILARATTNKEQVITAEMSQDVIKDCRKVLPQIR